MKNLFIFLLIVVSVAVDGQILQWEKVIQTQYNDKLWTAFPISGNKLLIQYKTEKSREGIQENHMALFDWAGNYSLNTSSNGERWTEVDDPNGNGKLLIGVGSLDDLCGWDIVAPWGIWYFDKLNTLPPTSSERISCFYYLWNTMQNEWGTWGMGRFPLSRGVFMTSSGTIITAGDSIFQRIWGTGEDGMAEHDTLDHNVIGLFTFHENLGLAFSNDALYTLDTNKVMSLVQPFQFSIDSVASTSNENEFIAFTNDTVRLIDTSGVVTEQITTTGLMDTVFQVSVKNNSFWMLGKLAGQLQLNSYTAGALSSTFIPDMSKADFRRFILDPDTNRFMLVGYETAVDNSHLLIQVYSEEITSFQKSDFNIGITSHQFVGTNPTSCFITYYSRFDLEILNDSQEPIDSFYINGLWDENSTAGVCSTYWFCYATQFSYAINEHINPGQSVNIEVGIIHGSFSPLPACFWVSSPNDQPDRDPSDDKICININVSTADLIKKDLAVKAFPNPASEIIQFHLPEAWKNKMYDLRITDITGRTIKSKKISETNPSDRVGELPDGIYLAIFRSVDGEEIATSFVVSK